MNKSPNKRVTWFKRAAAVVTATAFLATSVPPPAQADSVPEAKGYSVRRQFGAAGPGESCGPKTIALPVDLPEAPAGLTADTVALTYSNTLEDYFVPDEQKVADTRENALVDVTFRKPSSLFPGEDAVAGASCTFFRNAFGGSSTDWKASWKLFPAACAIPVTWSDGSPIDVEEPTVRYVFEQVVEREVPLDLCPLEEQGWRCRILGALGVTDACGGGPGPGPGPGPGAGVPGGGAALGNLLSELDGRTLETPHGVRVEGSGGALIIRHPSGRSERFGPAELEEARTRMQKLVRAELDRQGLADLPLEAALYEYGRRLSTADRPFDPAPVNDRPFAGPPAEPLSADGGVSCLVAVSGCISALGYLVGVAAIAWYGINLTAPTTYKMISAVGGIASGIAAMIAYVWHYATHMVHGPIAATGAIACTVTPAVCNVEGSVGGPFLYTACLMAWLLALDLLLATTYLHLKSFGALPK